MTAFAPKEQGQPCCPALPLCELWLGFDVIYDGNFTATAHDPFLAKLLSAQPEETYLFYLNASLNETLKRHQA